MGSPVGMTRPNSVFCVSNAVSVVLKLSDVGVLMAIAMVVIVDARNITHSINATFTFKLSPPPLFSHLSIMIYGDGKEKIYM